MLFETQVISWTVSEFVLWLSFGGLALRWTCCAIGNAGIEAQSASNGVHSFAVRRASIPAVHWIDLGQFELNYFSFSRTVIGSPERSNHIS